MTIFLNRLSLFSVFFGLMAAISTVSFQAIDAHAQEQIPVATAAVVDVNKVLLSSTHWKQADSTMKAQIQNVNDQIELRNNALKEKADELKRQQAILAPNVFQQKAAQLQQEQRDLQREMQVTNAKLNETLQSVRGRLKNIIVEISASVARDKGMNIGFDRPNVIFFKDAIDITDAVLERFNAAKIEISSEPAKQN
ncbi:OmpH family outer membrane protein [Sneathiella glossodoripedis]|uniref:OmpH family outer membrane protein n=1 Tax=Sneathiella glossodoripedis TaxID=418853 RepID=UPI00046FD719|nr:OmpH family outer membrane protein [Sneathiella glossodoripedis]